MSVASKNPFALLDDEVNSRPASPPLAAKSAPPQAPPAAKRDQPKTRGGPASRGGKYYARGGKPSAPKDASSAPAAGEEPAVDGRKEGGRGGRGGRGRGRGGNAGGRGRQFDRHSATGKTDSNKKVHQGWGGDEGTSELKSEEQAAADATAEVATGEAAAEGEAVPAAEGEAKDEAKPRREREEEEDNTLTLDQYLAQQKKDSAIPKIETVRQANEGAGDDLWKDAVAINKDEEEAYFVGKQKSAPKAKAKKEEKIYLEIEGRFERPDRGTRGGRGRGGDRGGERRGRGAGRGRGARQNGPAVQAPDVGDQSAFPSLS